MHVQCAERRDGLSAWCRIYGESDPCPDKRAGHGMTGGDTYPCADKSACDGRASGHGKSDREKGKQLQSLHEFTWPERVWECTSLLWLQADGSGP